MLNNTFSWQSFNSVRGTFQNQTYAYANGLPQLTPTTTASPTPTPTPSATPEALNWWLWNTNTSGNFANNTAINLGTLDLFYPSSQYDEISQGTVGVFARADDTIWHAGGNTGGNLGQNTVINYSSQIQVANAKYVAYGNGNSNGFRILNDGTLWSTGQGANGVLGINSITNRSSPVQESLGKTDWVKVASTGATTIGLDGSGRLWTTGVGTTGGLGNGAALSKSTFVQVGSDTNWADVRAGTGNVAANKSDGSWWVWGTNTSGQLGTNSTVNASSPIQFASDKTITKILLGGSNTYILTSANEIYACGSGANGIFGNSSVISRSSPALMLGGPWIDFMPYHTATLAIKNDNTLWGMGNINNNISLGVAAVPASSPVQINATKTWIRFPYLPFNQLGGVAILAVEAGFPTPTATPSPTNSPAPTATPAPSFGPLSCPYGAQTFSASSPTALTIPNGGDYAMGTGDFTVEWWQNATAGWTTFGYGLNQYVFSVNDNQFAFSEYLEPPYIDPQIVSWVFYANGTAYTLYTYNYVFGGTSLYGNWLHIAVVRASGVVTLYINGIAQGTATVTDNITDSSTLYVGDFTTHDSFGYYNYNGLITNFRIVKGTAIYTSNFSVPSAPLTNVSGCKLLMQVNSSGTIFTDSSSAGKTVTNSLGTVSYTSC
jgi:hypothetical protein